MVERRRRERAARDRDRIADRRGRQGADRSAPRDGRYRRLLALQPPHRGIGRDIRGEDLLRELATQVRGALVRQYGQLDACEDAVQEALLAAARQWPTEGTPDNPRSWLATVASRRLADQWRSESARHRREEAAAALELASRGHAFEQDDTLSLLFLCCHPSLSIPSQLALTLRAVGGPTPAGLPRPFLGQTRPMS